ncbi:MAG: hypothetical protein Q7S16_00010 [bacterium]|nr:hypothetical protein [bacterium]
MKNRNRVWFVVVGVVVLFCGYVVVQAQEAPPAPQEQPQAEQPAVPPAQNADVSPPVEQEQSVSDAPSVTRPLTDVEINALREFMRIMASGAKEQSSVSVVDPIPASVQKSVGDQSSSAQSSLVREVPYDHFTMKLNSALAEERRRRDIFYRDRLRSSADETIRRTLHELDEMIVGIEGVEQSAFAVLRFYEKERQENNLDAFDSLQDWAERSLVEARLFREGLEVERSAILGISEHPDAEYALYPPSFDRPDDPNGQPRNSLDEMLRKRIWDLNYDLSEWSRQVENLNYGLSMALLGDRTRMKAAQEQEKKEEEEAPK